MGIWGSCTSLVQRVIWQKWHCGLLRLNLLLYLQLRCVLLAQEGMFLVILRPANSPWHLTDILGFCLLVRWSHQLTSFQLCYTGTNTCKSAQCLYYVLCCPGCPGFLSQVHSATSIHAACFNQIKPRRLMNTYHLGELNGQVCSCSYYSCELPEVHWT